GWRLGWLAVLGIVEGDASARGSAREGVIGGSRARCPRPSRAIAATEIVGRAASRHGILADDGHAARESVAMSADPTRRSSVRRNGQGLDDTDRAIIEQLQQDGRLPYTRLASAVGLS